MKTNLGLIDEARLEIGQILNLLLEDETLLYLTIRDYHWNVTGAEFFSLHKQFEAHYTEAAAWIDNVAERARSIGIGARGSLTDVAKTARLSAVAGAGLASIRMVSALVAMHEHLAVRLRADSATCANRHKDAGTADFLTGLMEWHEKTAWLLRARIEDESAQTH